MSKTQEANEMSDQAENRPSLILPLKEEVKTAVILSPLRKLGQRKRKRYAHKLAKWVFTEAGVFPIGTQIMLEQVVEPGVQKEVDEMALAFQRSLIEGADHVVVGIDYGVSKGMKDGIDHALLLGKEVRYECVGLVDIEPSEEA